jgi:hypothetical protein
MQRDTLDRNPTPHELDAAIDIIARHVQHYAQEYAQPGIYEQGSAGRVLDQVRSVRDTLIRAKFLLAANETRLDNREACDACIRAEIEANAAYVAAGTYAPDDLPY